MLTFTADEWSQIDFTETPVTAKVSQRNYEVQSIINYDEEAYSVTITTDLVGFTSGIATYSVSIGNTDLPVGYNLKIELFEGV